MSGIPPMPDEFYQSGPDIAVRDGDRLIGWVEAAPDISMAELAAKLEAECGIVAHPASLSRFLLAAGFTVKKNAAGQRGRAR